VKKRTSSKASKNKPSEAQAAIDHAFPVVAKWVQGYGHIEIGDQDGFGFIVRAIDYGGLVFEDDKPATLAEAMTSLEKRLTRWFREQGLD
jgi:hypothetical protein